MPIISAFPSPSPEKDLTKNYVDALNTAMDVRVNALESINHDVYKTFFGGAYQLGYASKVNETSTDSEDYTLTLSESMDHFCFLYIVCANFDYAVASMMCPVALFKSKLPGASGYTHWEMNCINDQQDLFGGNAKYVSSTSVTGKFIGGTKKMVFYGVGRISS